MKNKKEIAITVEQYNPNIAVVHEANEQASVISHEALAQLVQAYDCTFMRKWFKRPRSRKIAKLAKLLKHNEGKKQFTLHTILNIFDCQSPAEFYTYYTQSIGSRTKAVLQQMPDLLECLSGQSQTEQDKTLQRKARMQVSLAVFRETYMKFILEALDLNNLDEYKAETISKMEHMLWTLWQISPEKITANNIKMMLDNEESTHLLDTLITHMRRLNIEYCFDVIEHWTEFFDGSNYAQHATAIIHDLLNSNDKYHLIMKEFIAKLLCHPKEMSKLRDIYGCFIPEHPPKFLYRYYALSPHYVMLPLNNIKYLAEIHMICKAYYTYEQFTFVDIGADIIFSNLKILWLVFARLEDIGVYPDPSQGRLANDLIEHFEHMPDFKIFLDRCLLLDKEFFVHYNVRKLFFDFEQTKSIMRIFKLLSHHPDGLLTKKNAKKLLDMPNHAKLLEFLFNCLKDMNPSSLTKANVEKLIIHIKFFAKIKKRNELILTGPNLAFLLNKLIYSDTSCVDETVSSLLWFAKHASKHLTQAEQDRLQAQQGDRIWMIGVFHLLSKQAPPLLNASIKQALLAHVSRAEDLFRLFKCLSKATPSLLTASNITRLFEVVSNVGDTYYILCFGSVIRCLAKKDPLFLSQEYFNLIANHPRQVSGLFSILHSNAFSEDEFTTQHTIHMLNNIQYAKDIGPIIVLLRIVKPCLCSLESLIMVLDHASYAEEIYKTLSILYHTEPCLLTHQTFIASINNVEHLEMFNKACLPIQYSKNFVSDMRAKLFNLKQYWPDFAELFSILYKVNHELFTQESIAYLLEHHQKIPALLSAINKMTAHRQDLLTREHIEILIHHIHHADKLADAFCLLDSVTPSLLTPENKVTLVMNPAYAVDIAKAFCLFAEATPSLLTAENRLIFQNKTGAVKQFTHACQLFSKVRPSLLKQENMDMIFELHEQKRTEVISTVAGGMALFGNRGQLTPDLQRGILSNPHATFKLAIEHSIKFTGIRDELFHQAHELYVCMLVLTQGYRMKGHALYQIPIDIIQYIARFFVGSVTGIDHKTALLTTKFLSDKKAFTV